VWCATRGASGQGTLGRLINSIGSLPDGCLPTLVAFGYPQRWRLEATQGLSVSRRRPDWYGAAARWETAPLPGLEQGWAVFSILEAYPRGGLGAADRRRHGQVRSR